MGRRFLRGFALLALVAALGVAAGCGGSSSSDETTAPTTSADTGPAETSSGDETAAPAGASTLTWTRLSDTPPCFHPICFQTGNQYMVLQLLYNTLVKRGPDDKTVIPDLADTWEVSDDGTEYTLHLNPDAKWHDGTPVTADDVLFTINQAAQFADDYVGTYPITNWLLLEGADTVKGTTNPVPGAEKVDDQTVKLTLAEPNGWFLFNLADPAYSILPKHLLEGETAETLKASKFVTGEGTVGSGPYKLGKFVPDQYMEFDANADYFKGQPQIGKLIMRLAVNPDVAGAQLESGELDLVFDLKPSDYQRLSENEDLQAVQIPGVGQQFLQFRTDNPVVADPRIRQAIYYAFDRGTLLETVFQGAGRELWVDAGLNPDAAGLDKYDHDPEKAKQLIAEAVADGKFDQNAPIRVIYYPEEPGWPEIAAALQNDLKAVGLNVVLEPSDAAAWEARLAEDNYEITLNCCGSGGLSPDIDSFVFDCEAPVATMYANCEVTDLYNQARATVDPTEQAALYDQVAQILNRDVPYGWLWAVANTHAATKDLHGAEWYPNARESFSQIEKWSLAPGS